MPSKITTVQRLFLNGTLIGSYPTVELAEQAATAKGPGSYDIVPVTVDVVTQDPVPPTESAPGTTVLAGTTAAIIDAAGNHWTITPAAQVAVNGVTDVTTAHVTTLVYSGGKVWQENAAKLWWSKANPTDSWAPPAGTATSPLTPAPVPPSPAVPTDAYVIYSNGKYNWPGDYNNGAISNYNYQGAETAPHAACLRLTIVGPWGEWLPYSHANPGPFLDISKVCNGKQAKSLQFKVKATKPNQQLSVYVISAGDVEPPASVPGYLSQAGAFPVGQWVQVTVALSEFGLGPDQAFSGNLLYKFGLQDKTGQVPNTLFVDDVFLLP